MGVTVISKLKQGAYLLDKEGTLIPVILHVPSTTFMSRGITELAPTDGEFLYNQNLITIEEYVSILLHTFISYLKAQDKTEYSMLDVAAFNTYGELRYAPVGRSYAMKLFYSGSVSGLEAMAAEHYPEFAIINNKWYDYLLNHYVKVSRFNDTVEFRISSIDHFDWNSIIIDDVILVPEYDIAHCKFNIVKSIGKLYRPYFLDATLNDILEHDTAVLAATKYRRKIINGAIRYKAI